jgi:hypothetical protein
MAQIEGLSQSPRLNRTPEGTLVVEALPPARRVDRTPTPRYATQADVIEREESAIPITSKGQAALKEMGSFETLTGETGAEARRVRAAEILNERLQATDAITGRRVFQEAAPRIQKWEQEVAEANPAELVAGTRPKPTLVKEDEKIAPWSKFVGEEPPPTLDKIPLRDGKFYAERFPGMKYIGPEGQDIIEADSWVIHRADNGKAVATMDVGKTPTEKGVVYSTDWTYYLDKNGAMHTKDTLKEVPTDERGLIGDLRKELVQLHGGVVSDRSGNTSPMASKSWEKTPDVQRVLPREGIKFSSEMVQPKYGIKGERNWGALTQKMKDAGYAVDEGQVKAWVKKYGGKAVLGAFGLPTEEE